MYTGQFLRQQQTCDNHEKHGFYSRHWSEYGSLVQSITTIPMLVQATGRRRYVSNLCEILRPSRQEIQPERLRRQQSRRRQQRLRVKRAPLSAGLLDVRLDGSSVPRPAGGSSSTVTSGDTSRVPACVRGINERPLLASLRKSWQPGRTARKTGKRQKGI
jgi:hypothetical protein